MAGLNDVVPVSMSGREEDLKIALHWLAGKANKSHSSLLGHSHCSEVRELRVAVRVMFWTHYMKLIRRVWPNKWELQKGQIPKQWHISAIVEVLQWIKVEHQRLGLFHVDEATTARTFWRWKIDCCAQVNYYRYQDFLGAQSFTQGELITASITDERLGNNAWHCK